MERIEMSRQETPTLTIHKMPAKEQLQRDILDEIARKHTMTVCPVCRSEVHTSKNLTCSLGHEIRFDYETLKAQFLCKQCRVVWEIEIFNWTDERGDGMIIGEGHDVLLKARSNCFCRLHAFEYKTVRIERNPHGHSPIYIGKECPRPD